MRRRDLMTAAASMAVVRGARAAAPVRIGVALSLTGELADSAKPYSQGLELWRRQTNAAGSLLGRPVELVSYDDRSDPATAARLYERLITSDNVDLLVSSLGSAATATASAVAERHKRLFINGGGAAEKIQERGFRYVVQTAATTHSYQQQLEPMARHYGFKTWAWVSKDYPSGRDAERDLQGIVARTGGQIVLSSYFPQGSVDISGQIARARQLDPDIWMSSASPNEAIEEIRQLRAANYLPRVFVCNGVAQNDFLAASGKDGEQATGTSVYEPVLKTPGNAEFVAAYTAAFGSSPGYYAAFGYVAGTVLGAAVNDAKTLDNDKLRDVLSNLRLPTVMGRFEIDPKTGMQRGVQGLMVQVLKGRREVIFPEEFRTAEPVIPVQPWSTRG